MDPFFDVVVVGAGPAGSLAAREIARRGVSVLLVEKSRFPRMKVCGCCVNRSALRTLESVGLGGLCDQLGGAVLSVLRLGAGKAWMDAPLRDRVAVSRARLDAALAEAACVAGARFVDGVSATLKRCAIGDGDHELELRGRGEMRTVKTRVVVAADGIGGRLLDGVPGFAARVSQGSHIGVGVVLEAGCSGLPQGVVQMVTGCGGYVGMVRLEDGAIDVAAAMRLRWVQRHGGPGGAVAALLREAGAATPRGLEEAAWRGTPRLTRRRRVAGLRVFVVGDAAGYVEPFTGEGMAWAMAGGVAVAELAVEAAWGWEEGMERAWMARHRAVVGRRQWRCRGVAMALRWPGVVRGVVRVMGVVEKQVEGTAKPQAAVEAKGGDGRFGAGVEWERGVERVTG